MSVQNISQILYSFSIEPILTGGVSGDAGKFLTLGDGQKVTSINWFIIDTQQAMQIMSNGADISDSYDEIKFESFNITNSIFSPIGVSTFNCIIDASTTGSTYNYGNPIIDVIREGDIFRAYYDSISNNNPQQLMVGTIENISITYNLGGCKITFNVGYLPNILARSQLVQTQAQAQVTGTTLQGFAPQQVVFGTFLHELLSETYINQTTGNTYYYGGKTGGVFEVVAAGMATANSPTATSGSAINADSYVFAVTAPTESKLSTILQILYPYQRVFYVDTNGDLNITPLTTFYDNTEQWSLDINGNPNAIPCDSITLNKNTTVLQNRAYCAMNQLLVQFVTQGITGANPAATGVAIATPTGQAATLFPRAYDMVQSGLGLQTAFSVQSFNGDSILQNSGLLNTAVALGQQSLQGMKILFNISNQNVAATSSYLATLDPLKYMMSVYAGRQLAESLMNDLLVDITIDTILTYNDNLGRFRKIPLNQTVTVPPVSNKNYDGQANLFCYGFNLSFAMGDGSKTTLNLCKPYVYTCAWCDELYSV
jgi:hypothetical protein